MADTDIWLIPRKRKLVEGATKVYTVDFSWADTVSVGSVDAFKNDGTATYASTVFPTNTPSFTGKILTLSAFNAIDGDGGGYITVAITNTINGDLSVLKFRVDIILKEAG